MKNLIKKMLDSYLKGRAYKNYRNQFKCYCNIHGIADFPVDGESEYINRWSVLTSHVEPYSYRLFSRYMGVDTDIIPEDIGHTYLENVLNPRRYVDFYSDKNLYDECFDRNTLPHTVLRRMGGNTFLDINYHPICMDKLKRGGVNAILLNSPYNRIILKPSIDSCSGEGVMLFERVNDQFVSKKEGIILSDEFLSHYGTNYILQEAIEQHPYMSQFNSTSVNTLRIAIYRSVKDESVNVTAAVIRIGSYGEVCDNGHMGGRFAGIELQTGVLNHYVCDQYGNMSDEWNGVNFKHNYFTIPSWNRVLDFARYIGGKNHHCRLLALDITLDKEGRPRLIEYNVSGFSFWLFMYSGQKPFGSYTNEVIDYCLKQKNRNLHLWIV